MKKLLVLFALLCMNLIHSQYEKGTIYKIDGSSEQGLIKYKNNHKIKFKSKSGEQPVSHNFESITGFDTHDNGNYRFKKYDKGFPPILFKLLKTGKMDLYLSENLGPGVIQPNGMMMGGVNTITYYIETFGKFIKLGPKLKKKDFYRFSACPGLVGKIKKREFKRNDICGIVAYYNSHYYDEQ